MASIADDILDAEISYREGNVDDAFASLRDGAVRSSSTTINTYKRPIKLLYYTLYTPLLPYIQPNTPNTPLNTPYTPHTHPIHTLYTHPIYTLYTPYIHHF